jgi:hypothetical protein
MLEECHFRAALNKTGWCQAQVIQKYVIPSHKLGPDTNYPTLLFRGLGHVHSV